VRAATTSLTRGVIKALQVTGLIRSEIEVLPPRGVDGQELTVTRRWGLEIGDLLDWEKTGQSLAARVAAKWHTYEANGVQSVLGLIEQKANEADLRMLKSSIRLLDPEAVAASWQALHAAGGDPMRLDGDHSHGPRWSGSSIPVPMPTPTTPRAPLGPVSGRKVSSALRSARNELASSH